MTKTLLSIGHGYCARAVTPLLLSAGWTVIGTTRSTESAAALAASGVTPVIWPGTDLTPYLQAASHILISTAPTVAGDPLLDAYDLTPHTFDWVGYLSTTGVYGDHNGAWVDEETPLAPTTKRGQYRVLAETQWKDQHQPAHIFRLAGIYGPGRGPFTKVREGTARRIIKPGQVF
ncbi:MAG: SDR family NAD(P)-dependent oxidoreductase, partial [Planktomarina sp.]